MHTRCSAQKSNVCSTFCSCFFISFSWSISRPFFSNERKIPFAIEYIFHFDCRWFVLSGWHMHASIVSHIPTHTHSRRNPTFTIFPKVQHKVCARVYRAHRSAVPHYPVSPYRSCAIIAFLASVCVGCSCDRYRVKSTMFRTFNTFFRVIRFVDSFVFFAHSTRTTSPSSISSSASIAF